MPKVIALFFKKKFLMLKIHFYLFSYFSYGIDNKLKNLIEKKIYNYFYKNIKIL